jgi:hypothetical protein
MVTVFLQTACTARIALRKTPERLREATPTQPARRTSLFDRCLAFHHRTAALLAEAKRGGDVTEDAGVVDAAMEPFRTGARRRQDDIIGGSGQMTVTLRDVADNALWSKTLDPQRG